MSEESHGVHHGQVKENLSTLLSGLIPYVSTRRGQAHCPRFPPAIDIPVEWPNQKAQKMRVKGVPGMISKADLLSSTVIRAKTGFPRPR